ncbi:phage integrase family protein [Rhizobium azibense]|uniref:Phage integrase family protein n=2 Tax=Rhizobium azibense TaxID=1136135 RepID=A0A4V2VDV0_9HYPH|nr:phage integrase family protein [Rhizobium azibense]
MRVFRFTNRHSVNERIRAVCRRAKIKYKPSHAIGRRKFATSLMAMGVDVKTAMDAGGWVSASVFLGTYVFTKNAGRVVSEKFNMLRYDEAV